MRRVKRNANASYIVFIVTGHTLYDGESWPMDVFAHAIYVMKINPAAHKHTNIYHFSTHPHSSGGHCPSNRLSFSFRALQFKPKSRSQKTHTTNNTMMATQMWVLDFISLCWHVRDCILYMDKWILTLYRMWTEKSICVHTGPENGSNTFWVIF